MTTNKTIVKRLALGLLATNIPVVSPVEATNETESKEDRFQTLKGETITISDSTDGSFKLVEIEGNTTYTLGNVNLSALKYRAFPPVIVKFEVAQK